MYVFSSLQRPSLVTVVEWIDYETLALLFGMVRLDFQNCSQASLKICKLMRKEVQARIYEQTLSYCIVCKEGGFSLLKVEQHHHRDISLVLMLFD